MILFEKHGQHQPLNRQAERFAREGVPPGACTAKTDTGRLWNYVREDRPFGGADPPAVVFRYSHDRRGEHPQAHLATWSGIPQADAFAGYGELYAADRSACLILEAGCFAHARRKSFELADKSRGEKTGQIYPIVLEAVQRLDALFEIERTISGQTEQERLAVRQELGAPLMTELHTWLTAQLTKLSRHHDLAKAINYMLRRSDAFTRFLADGRVCQTNNAAERALRCVPLGRKEWLFCGSDRGGQRADIVYSLIQTCRLNDVDPRAWLADILARIADHPINRLGELLPWNWRFKVAGLAA
eukprot:gene20541-21196_t